MKTLFLVCITAYTLIGCGGESTAVDNTAAIVSNKADAPINPLPLSERN
jgi:uncharacterized protein YcfL